MTQTLADAARAELARRELARRDFYDYARYIYTGYPQAAHLRLLARHLEDVERYVTTQGHAGCGRLMINMPPRYWKSTTVSVIFPTWFLGRNPNKRVIITSYNGSLAFGFSRRARNMMQDVPYRNVFGNQSGQALEIAIADDSRSVESWDLAGHRGGMAAAGVGGGITGKGADLFIIDDPHKDRAEAESEAKRQAVWNWYKSTAYTRLERGAAMIVIQTRWHADDLSGRLLQAMGNDPDADLWRVVSMPALAEDWSAELDADKAVAALKRGFYMGCDPLGRMSGEALWPEEYSLEALARIRVNVGGYEWESLYQQRPQRREGAIIRADQIRIVRPDQVPANLEEARYWDLAVSGKERADYIAGGRVGFTPDGRLYILHVEKFPAPWTSARGPMTKRMLRDPANVRQGIEVSGQQGGYYQELAIDEKLRSRIIEPVNPRDIGNKEVRAAVWASRIQDNLVFIVDDGMWDVEDFISECLAFPEGTHDDQVDAISGAVQMLGGWIGSLSDVPQDESAISPWFLAGGQSVPIDTEDLRPWQIQ